MVNNDRTLLSALQRGENTAPTTQQQADPEVTEEATEEPLLTASEVLMLLETYLPVLKEAIGEN